MTDFLLCEYSMKRRSKLPFSNIPLSINLSNPGSAFHFKSSRQPIRKLSNQATCDLSPPIDTSLSILLKTPKYLILFTKQFSDHVAGRHGSAASPTQVARRHGLGGAIASQMGGRPVWTLTYRYIPARHLSLLTPLQLMEFQRKQPL